MFSHFTICLMDAFLAFEQTVLMVRGSKHYIIADRDHLVSFILPPLYSMVIPMAIFITVTPLDFLPDQDTSGLSSPSQSDVAYLFSIVVMGVARVRHRDRSLY
jgi:hypothetical protein